MNPSGKIVIITGASSGIGAATARVFASAGAAVVLAARSADALQRLAAELPGHPLVIPTDVSDIDQVQTMVEQTITQHGRIDILINNAGVGLAGPIATLRPSDLQQTLAVGLFGPLYTIQAIVPIMQRQQRGHIINVSSVVGRRALPYLGGYAATKAALERLTEALRVELHGCGITVTLLLPGTTHTNFTARRLGGGKEQRRVAPAGVDPTVVARTILRAAYREPRVAYVTFSDRVRLWLVALAPALAERALAWSFSWNDDP